MGVGHAGFEAAVGYPEVGDVVRAAPEPDGYAGEVARSEGGGFLDGGAFDRNPKDVCLELHEQVVGGRAAVGPERCGDRVRRLGASRPARLGSGRRSTRGRPWLCAPCWFRRTVRRWRRRVGVPVGSAESIEGGNEVHASVVGDPQGKVLGLGGVGNQAEAVS